MEQDVLKLKLLCNIVLILSNSYWVSYFKKLSISVSGFTSLKLHFNFLSKWISKCCAHTHTYIKKLKNENFNMVTMKTKRYVKFYGSMQALEITQQRSEKNKLKIYSLYFQTNDPSVAINLILILREAIQAKTSWRSSTLLQIIKVNATEGVGKLLVRIQKMQIMQHQPLADHILVCIFWILSALATKGKTECYRLLILPKHKLYKLLV